MQFKLLYKNVDKCMITIIWILFFIFLTAQYQLIYLYYDDFGYFSLSYGYNAGIYGTDMSLMKVIEYLLHSYLDVNGRVFTNFLLVVAAWIGGIAFMRILIPVCILLVYVLVYQFIVKRSDAIWKKVFITIFLCFSYGLFSISVCRYGLYWFAAAFGYVIPMLMFLYFCKMYRKKNTTFIPGLAFLLCITSEQMIAMTVVYIIANMIKDLVEKKKIQAIYIITLLSAVISSLIMVGSPASRARMTSSSNKPFSDQNLFQKILQNAGDIVETFFCGLGNVFVVIVLLLFVSIAVKLLFKTKKNILHMVFCILSIIVMLLFIGGQADIVNFDEVNKIFLFLFFLFAFIEMFLFFLQIDVQKAIMVVSTAASIGLLLLVPELPERTFIPFMFMMILFAGDMLLRFEKKAVKVSIGVLLIPYILCSSLNIYGIYQGYERNVPILEYNNLKLIEASRKLENGQKVKEIELYRLLDEMYAGQQVYDSNVSYMKFWMDEFYSLPYEIKYVYYDYPGRENPITICHVND